MVAENIKRSLTYVGLKYQIIEPGDMLTSLFGETRFAAIILAAESALQFLPVKEALDFCKKGGTLFIGIHGWNPEFVNSVGILPLGRSLPNFFLGEGITSRRPLFLDATINIQRANFKCSALNLDCSAEWTRILDYKFPGGIPMLAERSFGEGRIVFWNSDCLHQKDFRGLFLFSLLRNLPFGIMNIWNTILIQIDDSPPPAFGIWSGLVARDFGLSDRQFYLNKWYDQVLSLLWRHDIKPTHFTCLQYAGNITPPFPPGCDRKDFFVSSLEKIRKSHAEIGFHGFNHQSLTLTAGPWGQWPNQEMMEEGLKLGKATWEEMQLPMPFSYAAPNNIMDAAGKRALAKVFPSIKAIFRLYINENDPWAREPLTSSGGDEFGPDPDVPGLFDIPRMSSGYHADDVVSFSILNGVMAHGLVNHYFHPDDLYDEKRSRDKSWEFLLAALERLLKYIDKIMPKGRKIFGKEFIMDIKRDFSTVVDVESIATQTLRLTRHGEGKRYWYLFTHPPFRFIDMEGGQLISILEDDSLFLIELASQVTSLHFSRNDERKSPGTH